MIVMMNEFPAIVEIVQTAKISGNPVVVIGVSVWALGFFLLGLILGRAAFKAGRAAVVRIEEENTMDTIRLEQYRHEIDLQSCSTVLRRFE